MRWKKGDLELRYIALLIIAVIVIIVIVIIFRTQINNFMRTLFEVGREINASRPRIGDIIG